MTYLALDNLDFIKSLKPLCKRNNNLFRSKIKSAKKTQINSLSELFNNLLNGNIKCSRYKRKLLQPHAQTIRFIANKKNSLRSHRNNISTKKGVFLLGAILPAAISAIGTLLAR